MRTKSFGALAALSLGAVLAIAPAIAANAHVGLSPSSAAAGETAALTFTIPNESETASTTKVEILLPTDTPLVNVRYQAIPGWTTAVLQEELAEPVTVGETTITTAPTRVIYTADPQGGIAPFAFETFTIRVGPVPEAGNLVLPVVQSYDDGEVSDWSATPEQYESDESLSPAPVLYINDAAPEGGHGSASSVGAADDESIAPNENGGLLLGLAISALAVAVFAGALAIAALVRSGRRAR
ncbi:YcnI family protein [Herbiconiux sp. L3-i23]|uniref:YcnI family copper-binding membrane protein n=1 Tax=Herbiconiux sp. L3-i23 TaxID=2905871 RepID=UPI00205EBB7B|nr:YcnI family protein [Herbiconiux sp. L3-i23]BDI21264.1 hypothetical protein L3i23_00400 [Herbiconiux sp. L3-i23]